MKYSSELREIITSNRLTSKQLESKLQREFPHILEDINVSITDAVDSFMEKCWLYVSSVPKPVCGENSFPGYRFDNFKNGYVCCGRKCPCAEAKKRETNLQRYGVEHSSKSESYKQKVKSTLKQRYGVETLSEVNPEKRKQTNLERYGSETPLGSDLVQGKIKQSVRSRFGVDKPFQSPEVQTRIGDHFASLNPKGQRSYVRGPEQIEQQRELTNAKMTEKYPLWGILVDPEMLAEQLRIKSRKALADEIGCSVTTVDKKVFEYGLEEFQNSPSYYEELIGSLLDSHGVTYIRNTRKIIPPKELDFFLPDHDLAIEFNGLRWHGERYGRDKFYHVNKQQACSDKGIHLIQIFQDEFDASWEIIKNIILSQLGKIENVVYARNTSLGLVSHAEASEFLEENHLQGSHVGGFARYGLYVGGQLVQLMTFTHKSDTVELKRLCTRLGYRVIGGANKLFKAFTRDHDVASVMSYSEPRYFSGKVYSSLGFQYVGTSQPGYAWSNGRIRSHRLNHTKKKLISEGFDESLTEDQIMIQQGFDKIWDCGQAKWVWNR